MSPATQVPDSAAAGAAGAAGAADAAGAAHDPAAAALADVRAEALARALSAAWTRGSLLPAPADGELPVDAAQACDIQHRVLALRGQPIAGWKVGAKSADGPVQGAPLPADRTHAGPATLPCAAFPTLALEVEIAFCFARAFLPQAQPYDADEVLASIGQMFTTIEIVSSRYAGWPAIEKRAQLADLQNHGALVTGAPVPYDAAFAWTACSAQLELDGARVARGASANPAGDPRRLLPWLVNHARSRGLAILTDTVITTGSYTGMHFTRQPGRYRGRIEGLPPVELALIA